MLTEASGEAARTDATASSTLPNRCPGWKPRTQAWRWTRSGPKLTNWANVRAAGETVEDVVLEMAGHGERISREPAQLPSRPGSKSRATEYRPVRD